jgi:dolichol-phosphate mannosyltransferase
MAFVSLIVPIAPGAAPLLRRIDALGRALGAAGHDVEVLAVADPRSRELPGGLGPEVRLLVAGQPGKAASAYRGLHEATGELLVIVDLEKGYDPEAVGRVLEPLVRGEADVVVASPWPGAQAGSDPTSRRAMASGGGTARRGGGPLRWILDPLLRPLVGITDPSCGLVAVTRASYQARDKSLTPLGSRFVLELLVGSVGRRLEVPIPRHVQPPRLVLGPSDLRLFKRLADHRFGNYSRLLQFCVVGASGMVIDLSSYAFFQVLFAGTFLARLKTPLVGAGQTLDLAAAAALAIAIALGWNFSLNRRLTFNDARQGSIVRQFVTYALGNALGIALSYSVRLYLPGRIGFFARHKLAAAVVGIVAATGISFSMSRWVVFTRHPGTRGRHRQANQATAAERA